MLFWKESNLCIKASQTSLQFLTISAYCVFGPRNQTTQYGKSRPAFYEPKNVNWDRDWSDVASSSGDIEVWNSWKIILCTFWRNPSRKVPMEEPASEALLSKEVLKIRKLSVEISLEQVHLLVFKITQFDYQCWSYVTGGIANFRRRSFCRKFQIDKKIFSGLVSNFFNGNKSRVRRWWIKMSW